MLSTKIWKDSTIFVKLISLRCCGNFGNNSLTALSMAKISIVRGTYIVYEKDRRRWSRYFVRECERTLKGLPVHLREQKVPDRKTSFIVGHCQGTAVSRVRLLSSQLHTYTHTLNWKPEGLRLHETEFSTRSFLAGRSCIYIRESTDP